MLCQMMRVISSPSSSTTGFLTLILLMVAIVRIAEAEKVWEAPKLGANLAAGRRAREAEGRVRELNKSLETPALIVDIGGGKWERVVTRLASGVTESLGSGSLGRMMNGVFLQKPRPTTARRQKFSWCCREVTGMVRAHNLLICRQCLER